MVCGDGQGRAMSLTALLTVIGLSLIGASGAKPKIDDYSGCQFSSSPVYAQMDSLHALQRPTPLY